MGKGKEEYDSLRKTQRILHTDLITKPLIGGHNYSAVDDIFSSSRNLSLCTSCSIGLGITTHIIRIHTTELSGTLSNCIRLETRLVAKSNCNVLVCI